MDTKTKIKEEPLVMLDLTKIKNNLVVADNVSPEDATTEKQANETVEKLLALDPSKIAEKEKGVTAIENMGSELQKMAARRSNMLKQSIGRLSKSGDDGGPVANALVDLRIQIEELDPHNFEFSMSFLRRILSVIPGVGTPIARYFTQYQSADTVINDIVISLEKGREQLKRDNLTLATDQAHFHDLAEHLKKAVAFGRLVDDKLTTKLDTEIPSDDPQAIFLREEVQFPLRQRIQDLQQQLAVSQQGQLTIEVIRRNNKELIRGVNRALNVTVNALQIAVTLALALANQKIVLEKINAINSTTNDLIARTAENLKIQGAEIHKQAASAQLDIEVLKQAFDDINSALEDISQYRNDALPKMAATIIEMDELTTRADESVKKFKKAQAVDTDFGLDLFSMPDAEFE